MTNKTYLLILIIIFLGFFLWFVFPTTVGVTKTKPILSYEMWAGRGLFTRDDIWINSETAGVVKFQIVYGGAACKVEKYELELSEKKILLIKRFSARSSCQKHLETFVIKGKIEGLLSGEYQLKVVEESTGLRSRKDRVFFERVVTVK